MQHHDPIRGIPVLVSAFLRVNLPGSPVIHARLAMRLAAFIGRPIPNLGRRNPGIPCWRTGEQRIGPQPDHLLPTMKADAILRGNGRTIVVECKFYEKTLQTHYLGDSAKLHSGHLYQLSTYLLNLGQGPEGIVPEGLLVYPTTEVRFQTDLILSGKRIRTCTLDLNVEPWERVAEQMLGFLEPPKPAPAVQVQGETAVVA